jgi:hypothetical protein
MFTAESAAPVLAISAILAAGFVTACHGIALAIWMAVTPASLIPYMTAIAVVPDVR